MRKTIPFLLLLITSVPASYLSPILDTDMPTASSPGLIWTAGSEYFYGSRLNDMDGKRVTEQKYFNPTTGEESIYPLDSYQRDWWVLLNWAIKLMIIIRLA